MYWYIDIGAYVYIDIEYVEVTLYYCGAPQAGEVIQPICDKLGFVFRKEIF